MGQIAYIVTATLPDRATTEEYIAWLRDEHVSDVIARGASTGEIILLDPPTPAPSPEQTVEVRYHFADRHAFETYERDEAPALRAHGLARFGHRGITFQRRLGEVIPLPEP